MILPLLLLLFAASGCAALMYEIVWFKLLEMVTGSTGVAVGVLLAIFMGGLFAGSLCFPRFVSARKHPLKVYAVLEAGIGLLGIAVILGLNLVEDWYISGAGPLLGGVVARIILATICLLPPTILMGASLPAISRWVETTPRGVSWLGWLYATNTLGALAGCSLAGFYLLRVYDTHVATYWAAAFNFAAAAASYLLATRAPYETPAETAPAVVAPAEGARDVYVVIALSGAAALSAEVVWTRLLGLMLGGTVYTFSVILAVFLAGIGIGGGVGSFIVRRGWPARIALAITQFLLIAGVAWCAYLMTKIPWWPIITDVTWKGFASDLLRVTCAVLPAALLWGASFPLALGAAAAPGEDSAKLAGGIYAANTLGAIIGALACSLVLIPWIGTFQCERVMIVLAAAGGLLLLPPKARATWGYGAAAIAALACFLIPNVPWQIYAYGHETTIAVPDATMLYVGEGRNASIAVSQNPDGTRFFHISGKTEASSEPYDMRVERMLGHLPVMMHPNPRTVLIVGCGAGITTGSVAMHPEIQSMRICELEPLVPQANSKYFAIENHDVIHDPRLEIVFDDARHHVLASGDKFDIVTSDPVAPWVRGSSTLYTKEYYELCKRHMNPGGVIVSWLPFYETNTESVKSEVATFLSVFPNGAIWSNDIDGEGYDSLIMGVNGDAKIDIDQWQARLERRDYAGVRKSLAEVGFRSALDLLATYAGSGHDLDVWLQGSQLNLDKDLRLEYLAGAGMRVHMAPAIYDDILAHRQFPSWLLTGSDQRMELLRLMMHAR